MQVLCTNAFVSTGRFFIPVTYPAFKPAGAFGSVERTGEKEDAGVVNRMYVCGKKYNMFKDEAMIQRAKDIYKMRMEGMKFKEIGSKYNISASRAQQVFGTTDHMIKRGRMPGV